MSRPCKYCSAEIDFRARGDGWMPIDPATGYDHHCLRTKRSNTGSSGQDRAGFDAGYRQGYTAGRSDALLEAQRDRSGRLPGTLVLNRGDVTKLLQLCHPDHQPPERAQLAHVVTVRLNALAEELEAGRC